MIFLFNNCYLSTTKQIVENAKHIWIGSHPIEQDLHSHLTFDIYKSYDSVDADILDKLFEDIYNDLENQKTIIYTDVEHFSIVYFFFFGGILPLDTVKEMYEIDRQKEQITKLSLSELVLPEQYNYLPTFSTFTPKLNEVRLELALIQHILGSKNATEYCVDRVSKIWKDGSPGFRQDYVEQYLPAFLTDEEYTLENLLNPNFIDSYKMNYKNSSVIPNEIVGIIKEKFGFDYINHFFNVINENNLTEEQYTTIWDEAYNKSTQDYVRDVIINPKVAVKMELLFPNISNFDSINPIFWNKIFKNCDDTEWLRKFIVNNGINNQAHGTL